MTRAQEILALAEAIGDPKPFKKAVSPFKHQHVYKPGQKVPAHVKMRQDKQKQIASRSSASYSVPWKGQHDDPKDKSANPLDKPYKGASAMRTG